MKCPDIPDLTALTKCLQGAVEGDGAFMVFGSDLFTAAGQLAGYVNPSAAPSFRIDRSCGQDIVQPGTTDVRVVGTASLFAGVKYDVVITGTVPSPNDVRLSMTLTASDASAWTFGANFTNLPDYNGYAEETKEEPRGIRRLPSFFYDTVINPVSAGQPIFFAATFEKIAGEPAGLYLDGLLDASKGAIGKQVGPYLPPGDRSALPISGPVAVREKTFPLIALTAPVPGLTIPNLAQAVLLLGTEDDIAETPPGNSTADMGGVTTIGSFPAFTIKGPVLEGRFTWILTATVADPQDYSLAAGMSSLVQWVGGTNLTLPAGLDFFASFYIDEVKIGLDPEPNTPVVNMLGISIHSSKDWVIPMSGLTISDVGTNWRVVNPLSNDPVLEGSVTGTILITLGGEKETAPRLWINVDLTGLTGEFAPNVVLEATLDQDRPLNLGTLFSYFTGLDIGKPVNALNVTALDLRAETGPRLFFFCAEITNSWQPLEPLFTFDSLIFQLDYAPNRWTGSMTATMHLSTLPFQIGANYRGPDRGWRFTGALMPVSDPKQLTLGAFLLNLNDQWTVPDFIGNIALLGLSAYFDTLTSEFGFDTTVGWNYTIDRIRIEPEAQFKLDRTKTEGGLAYSGFVRGTLKVNAFEITVIYDFAVTNNTTLTFRIRYNDVIFTCVYTKNAKGESIVRASLGGVTFGGILEYLINLVDPDLGFRFSSPWDVLYQISFDNLSLEANLTTKTVGVRYALNLNLGFVKIDTIGLTYVNNAGQTTVMMSIVGEFLGAKYGEDDPLEWDVLNDTPPVPAGEGEQLLDLRYLGFGQSVTFRETKSFANVQSVIDALQADFDVVEDDANPLLQLPRLKFSGNGNWIIGADFTVMGAVSIRGVFNDPVLYGIRIGLAGPKVKTFDGLEFEILYKKITDTIGLYHIELTLPKAMRQINLGAIAITVPIVDIDIYTNGNFRIDLGFPVNRDFTRSFCVQGGPFIGYGGFFFGYLDGETSEVVPRITNGSFAPVIEAGVGLSIGLGRTFNFGILSGGLTLTLEGIVQGALAWFNPNDSSTSTAVFYRIEGTVAITGKVYGAINFIIIKASFSLTAFVSLKLIFESYRAIEVEFTIGVRISVKVKIIFFTITMSFGITLRFAFRIGSGSRSPWILAAPDPRPGKLRLRGQRSRYSQRALRPVEVFRMLRAIAGETPVFDWMPRSVFDSTLQNIPILLTPSLTPAIPSAVTASVRSGYRALDTVGDEPITQIVMALFVPTSIDPTALHAEEVIALVADDAAEAPFNVLAAGVFRWTVGALQKSSESVVYRTADGNDVTIGQLDAISCFLSDRVNRDATFTYERVTGMIEQNFLLQLSNPIGPTGGFFDAGSNVARAANDPAPEMAIFPMIPEIAMAPADAPAIKFWSYACVDQAYRDALETYYDQLAVDPEANVPKDPLEEDPCAAGPISLAASGPLRGTPLPPGCAGGTLPLSSIVFTDYFAMIAQQSVDAAVEMLTAYPYESTGAESLDSIVAQFSGVSLEYRTRSGESIATIAAQFGVQPSALRRANEWLASVDHDETLPSGSYVQLDIGPTPGSVATANASYPLQYNAVAPVRMKIDGVLYQVLSEDTLSRIVKAFLLAGPAALVNAIAIDSVGRTTRPNTTNVELLRSGAKFVVPSVKYVVTADDMIVSAADAQARIAALFYTRAGLRTLEQRDVDRISWYEQTIASTNAAIVAGVKLNIPVATLDEQQQIVDSGKTTPYVMKESDTLAWIAAMFELLQLSPTDPGFVAFAAAITSTPPPPIAVGTSMKIPTFLYTVSAGETFDSIASTFNVPIDESTLPAATAALADANPATDILAPLAVLLLPALDYPIVENDTLDNVARKFNLTVEELSASIDDTAGIFAPYSVTSQRMTVPDVASRDLDLLVADLVRFGSFNSLAAGVSRFLLNGMRAPLPQQEVAAKGAEAGEKLWGLYDVIGQQFPAPSGTSDYTIELTKGSTASWFCFEQPPGMRGASGATAPPCTDSLSMILPAGFIAENQPSLELDPLIVEGPSAMRLFEEMPAQFTLQQSIHWQSATTVPLPGPTGFTGATGIAGSAGEPALWLFPEDLQQEIVATASGVTGSTEPYELKALEPSTKGGSTSKPLSRYSWATAIPLTITRALAADGGFVPRAYQIIGADASGRDLLLDAWSYLESEKSAAQLYLLYAPSAQSTNPSGLASDAIADAKTYLLKTNLSTETNSNASLAFAIGSGQYYSGIDSPGAFLKAVWEASITGTGGFFLNYANTSGEGLPEALFATDGTAAVWAVLLLGKQTAADHPDRRLYPFNNCAVLAENLDATALQIFAELQDPTPAELRRVASVQPGSIGFSMVRANASDHPGPTGITQRLYNLVGYEVLGNRDFIESHEGLPLGPLDDPPSGMTGATGLWYYQQVIPISRFGIVNDCPSSDALPDANENPYRGITGPAGKLSSATLSLAFHDVYGNETTSTDPLVPFDAPVGYIDDLIGVSSWPGGGFGYLFRPAAANAIELDTTLALQNERYLPNEANPYETAIRTANADAERYKQVFYQVQQLDVAFALESNIGSPLVAVSDLKADVTSFITRAKVFADAMRTLLQATAQTESESLGDFAKRVAVTAEAVAVANADTDATKLFAGLYVKPIVAAAAAMNTLEALAAQAIGREDAPNCNAVIAPDDTCSPTGLRLVTNDGSVRSQRATSSVGESSDPDTVAKNNLTQPLTPGITLRTKSRTVPLAPLFSRGVENTLAAIAADQRCNVYAGVTDPDAPRGPRLPTGLMWMNWTTPQLLQSGITLIIDAVSVVTDDSSTFANVYESFREVLSSLTAGDFAAGIADTSPIFRTDKNVVIADFVVPQPPRSDTPGPVLPTFSLADLAKSIDIAGIPTLDRAVANFFYAGSPIFLGYSCCKPVRGDTVATLAGAASLTIEQFAAFNRVTTLNAGVTLKVPNLTSLADVNRCWSPYTAAAADSLDIIARNFGSTSLVIGALNRNLPGIFATGAAIKVGGKTVNATASDSLQSVYAQFLAAQPSLTFDDFIQQLASQAGLYRANGVIVTPLAKVPATKPAFETLAAALNIDTVTMLTTNAALRSFLRDGSQLYAPGASAPLPVGAYDTIDTVIRRFRDEQGVTVTVAGLAAANAGVRDLMTAGSPVLIPPHVTTIQSAFAPQVPPAGATGENAVIFPIEVRVVMTRAQSLVSPDFAESEPVFRSVSQLDPEIVQTGDVPFTLADFAELFEQAFAKQKLKCAVTTQAATDPAQGVGRIYAVNFGPTGIRHLAVDASLPKFYALRPIATEAFSGDLRFPLYVSGAGLCSAVTKRFEGVDLDAWMLKFLQTVDLFLTPPYVMPAFQLGATGASSFATPFDVPAIAAPQDGPSGLMQVMPSMFSAATLGMTGCTGSPPPNGPADFDAIVAAKQQLASVLRDNVWPIVDAPGASGPYEWDAAREALYQQMLVRLSDGYTVSSVVQFPVNVESPFVTTATDAPPRISGKVVPVTYALDDVAGTNTIASVAAHYAVSSPFLAQVIGNTQGLLEKGAHVDTYEIGPYDTINTVAAHFGIPTDPAQVDYWTKWSPFIDGIAALPLFVTKASFPLSGPRRRIYDGDALEDIASFFARDVITVARANQKLPGILRPGPLRYDGYPNPYDVRPTDDLIAVAAGISNANPTQPRVTVDDLALDLRTNGRALQPGVELAMIETLPVMSLSTSKVTLGRIGSPTGPAPALSFLLTVKEESERNKVLVSLEYAINEIEYAIRNVPNAGTYQASSWLTLVLPIGSGRGVDVGVTTNIAQVQIPIPLRAYPPPSILRAHSGTTANPDDPDMTQARLWDYRFDVETRKAAQDTDHIRVKFGEQQTFTNFAGSSSANLSLITWLAAFIDAYPLLSNDLAQLTNNVLDDTSGYAVSTLAVFATKIAGAFASPAAANVAAVSPVDLYEYKMTTGTDGVLLRTLTLKVEAGPTGASAIWPQMFIKSLTGLTGSGPDAGFLPMEGTDGFYLYPKGVDYPADLDLTYRFLFEDRDVIRNQTGRGGISISRNDNLIAQGPLGPTGLPAAVQTSEEFIYRTPFIEFVNPLIPLIDNDAAIDLSRPTPQPLEQYILTLLAGAIDVIPNGFGPSQSIDMLCLYGFPLGDAGLIATTPVRLVPSRLVGGGDVRVFAKSLAMSLDAWRVSSAVPSDQGLLIFQLSVFTEAPVAMQASPRTVFGEPLDLGLSSAVGASAAALKPIFRLHNVRVRMNTIDWATSGPAGLGLTSLDPKG